MKDLKQCREEIDKIDQEMIALFEKRMNVAKDVVTYKMAHDMAIFQADREQQVIEKNMAYMNNQELVKYAQLYMRDLMNISKSYQATFLEPSQVIELKEPKYTDITVGYPGVSGSFSEKALDTYFSPTTKRKNYEQFDEVFQALKNDEIDYGIVPLENSSTGAINDNYDAIRDYGFYIVGEQSLSISQHLLAVKGTCVENLTEVYSHPQGLLQTSEFLHQHPDMKQNALANTAIAARFVATQKNPHFGAIASMNAAHIYGLEVLQENIQNVKTNATRFIIFSKNLEHTSTAGCVSIVFTLNHQVGSLYQVMKIINDHQINMLRIESRPLKDTPWEYYFYVDFEGNLKDMNIIYALEDMKAHTLTLRVLGNYTKK